MQYLGLFFLLGMILEVYTLFLMASWIGGFATFALLILGVLAGSALLRNKFGVAKAIMAGQFLRGGVSFYDMFLPIRVPLAGVLLMLPTGFLSSLIGLLLLFPFQSSHKMPQNHQRFADGFQYTPHRPSQHDDDVIEGEYVVRPNPNDAKIHHKS